MAYTLQIISHRPSVQLSSTELNEKQHITNWLDFSVTNPTPYSKFVSSHFQSP